MSHNQYFNKAARTWDDNPARHEMANALFQELCRHVRLDRNTDVLDFGAGTGLVTLPVAQHAGSVTAMDSSDEMLTVLKHKANAAGLDVRTQRYNGTEFPDPGGRFDVIVSTMVLHHIAEPAALLKQFAQWLRPGGHLVLADLEPEDGSFHGDNPTVHHHGFDPQQLCRLIREQDMNIQAISRPHCIRRPQGNGTVREYPVFLLVAEKPVEHVH